ncbi:MAG: YigZ family protein [Desulfobacula sp.]|nr:YigZ family protein [Desulfobacula sp.]
MAKKYFYSIKHQRRTDVKIKRSVFICTMAYVQSIKEAKEFIAKISKENQTAAHNCWAYIVGEKGDIFHSSDAGEPSGTAGKPMLNALQSHCMTDIAVVVTRHFGGVKLGVRGLIEAYSLSVKNTINLKQLRKLVQMINLRIEVSYEFNDTLLHQLKDFIVQIKNTDYSDKIVHVFEIELENFKSIDKLLSEYQSREMIKFTILEKHV